MPTSNSPRMPPIVFNRFLAAYCSLLVSLIVAGICHVQAEELRLTAAELFARSSTQNVQLSADGKSIELIRGLLIENDGDAAGFSYKPNEEALSDGTTAIKWLTIPEGIKDLSGIKAYLLVGHTGKTLQAEVNGQKVMLAEPQKAGNYWKRYGLPSNVLRSGKNELRLTGEGKLWIARSDERSSAAGKEEQLSAKLKPGAAETSPNLGPQNDIGGEYYVRLFLDVPPIRGSLRLKLDGANINDSPLVPSDAMIESCSVKLKGYWDLPAQPEVRTDLLALTLSGLNEIEVILYPLPRIPRDAEIEIFLDRQNSTQTRLTGAIIRPTRAQATKAWPGELKVISQHNPAFQNRSFKFEPLDHPRLAQFRQQYALDEVVKSCTTDLQRMEKLAVWTSQQWTKGHLKDIYPKWDALEILKKHEDGTPIGGFCQQFNIVFLQACASFGMVGRAVSIGAGDHGVNIRSGHEVVEIWSNELNKWVYVDGQAAWYFIDKETRTPLNLLELRARQIATLRDQPAREVEIVVLAKSPYEWKGLREWPAFTELRMIPHTQFLDGKLPLPLNQGMRGWFWTGHRVWTDELMPASVLYSDRVTNVNDWNFAVNQTQIWLEQREKQGELSVRLTHNMPSFANYVLQIEGENERKIAAQELDWKLRAGENRLQVRAVNKLGALGPPSWIKLQYTP